MSTPTQAATRSGGEESPSSAVGAGSSDEYFLVDVPPSAFHQAAVVEPAQAGAPPLDLDLDLDLHEEKQEEEPSAFASPKRSTKRTPKAAANGGGIDKDETDDTSEITRILADFAPTDGPSAFTRGDADAGRGSLVSDADSDVIDISSGRMDRLPERRDSDDLKELFVVNERSCKDHPLSRALMVIALIAAVGVAFSWYQGSIPTPLSPVSAYADGTEILPYCYADANKGRITSDLLNAETKALVAMNISHPEQCCTECLKHEACVAYSYNNGSSSSASAAATQDVVCFLHSAVGDIQSDGDAAEWFYVLRDSIGQDVQSANGDSDVQNTEAPATTVPAVVTTEAPQDDVREDLKPLKNRIAMLVPFMGSGFSPHIKSVVLPTLRGNADLLDVFVIANEGTDFGETEGNVIVKYLPDNGVRRMFHDWTLKNMGVNMTEVVGEGFWGWRYKIVDYKPMYGSVFKDWLPEDKYSHWGYCDLDVIYGKLSLFVTQDMLDEYDAFAMLDVRRKSWMMNGPFSLYRNNDFGREHWKLIKREGLIKDLTNDGVAYVDEHISSPPIITDAHASFAFIFAALQGNYIIYPNWTITWEEANGHLIWRPDPDLTDEEKNVKEGPITDIKPNHRLQTIMKKDSLTQWSINGWGDYNPSSGFNYYLRTKVEEDPSMTWRAKRIDHERIFRTDLGEATYELAFVHFYRIALGREFELAAKKLKVDLKEKEHRAKAFQIKWNGLNRGEDKPKPAYDIYFTELELEGITATLAPEDSLEPEDDLSS